ncbi:MAG: ArsB/NhaD family transporter [Planctomycetota bacterium]|nr:ArsB/NhaD family transporter [Planctomycetota bacterium]
MQGLEETTAKMVLSAVILVFMFAMLVFSRIHRTLIGLFAACAVLASHITPFEKIITHIDMNVLMLLTAMMLIVTITRTTGLFQFIAIKSAKLAGGDPLRLLLLFGVITALVSAFFDNVTTVLLISPITLLVCAEFRISPIPFLISQAVASNFGGVATLIGDPPNIMIGSAADLSFNQFIIHLAPLVVVVISFYALLLRLTYRKKVGYTSAVIRARLATMDERKSITNKKLLFWSLVVLFMTLVGLALHAMLKLEAGVIALCGATLLLLISRADIVKILEELELSTLLFFICLYIVIGASFESGLLKRAGNLLANIAPRDEFLFSIMVMWISAFLSALTGSVPLTAIMIPLIKTLPNSNPSPHSLWWALAIGAGFGGNMTLIGAAANLAVAGIAERSGHQITFKSFFLHGAPITLLALTIASFYLFLRYFLW